MTIEERLKKLKKDELVTLARKLNATGYSGLGKGSLIDHIIDNYNEQDITAALYRDSQITGEKIPWWKRHKIESLLVIIGLIGSIASIYSIFKPSLDIKVNPEEVVKILIKKNPGISQEEFFRLKEKVTELEIALKDEKSGNLKERKEALIAIKNGNTTKAQELFKQRTDYINLGNTYYLDLKYKEALKAYDKAIEIKPDNFVAWTNKGVAFAALGRHEDALEAYDKAIEIKPDFNMVHKAWSNKGGALADLGRHQEALKAYNKAIDIKSNDYKSWTNKGFSLAALGRHQEALKAYEKAIEIKPDDHKIWHNRGNVLRKLGRYEEALKSFNKVVEIKPEDHKAWNNKGVALADLGRYTEALKAYDKAIRIKPDFHLAWANKGNTLRELGRHEEALKAHQLATKYNAVDLKLDDITAKQILYRMAKTYGECNTYRDSGILKNIFIKTNSSWAIETRFKTAFVRPDRFRFEFKKVKADMIDLHQIIWRKGNEVKTWSNLSPGAGVESSESLIFAIASATGISDGAALTISIMLLPKELIGWSLTDMTEANRIEDAKSREIDCFRIKGMYNGRTITIWIDKKKFLICRIDEKKKIKDFLTETTTYYEPVINEEVTEKMLEFNPPMQK